MSSRSVHVATYVLIVAVLAGCDDIAPTAARVPAAATVSASRGSGSGSGGGSGGGGGRATTPAPTPPPTPVPAPAAASVASVSVAPSIVVLGTAGGYVVGGTTGIGTVTLSTPAATPTVVSLSSDNGFVLPVPASVTVPAGARTATFPVGSLPVRGTFTLNLSAGIATITATTRVYVVPTANTDIITIPTLTLSPKRTAPPLGEVRVQATSTNPAAVLTAYGDGAPVATLRNEGGGRFSATFTIPALDDDIEVRSTTNGCGVRATNRPTQSRSCPSL